MRLALFIRLLLTLATLVGSTTGDAPRAEAQSGHKVEVVPLVPNTTEIVGLRVSPDGRLLISTGLTGSLRDGRPRLWDVATGRLLRAFNTAHPEKWDLNSWYDAAPSSDATRMAVASKSGLELWSLVTAGLIRRLSRESSYNTVIFGANEATVISGDGKNRIRLWETANGKLLKTLSGHTAAVRALALSKDGARLASGGNDKTVRVWNMRTGRLERTMAGHPDEVIEIAWLPDGRIASAGGDVRIWGSDDVIPDRALDVGAFGEVRISPDGRLALTGKLVGSRNKLWNFEFGTFIRELGDEYAHPRESFAVLPDWRHIVQGSTRNTIRIFDIETGLLVREITPPALSPSTHVLTLDSRRVVQADDEGRLSIWDLYSGQSIRILRPSSFPLNDLFISDDGDFVAGPIRENNAAVWQIWDLRTGDLTERRDAATFDPSQRGWGRGAWNIGEFQPYLAQSRENGSLFRAGERELIGDCSRDGEIEITSKHAVTGKELSKTSIKKMPCSGQVAFLPDGRQIAVSSVWGDLELWDLIGSRRVRKFSGHANRIDSVDVTPDGQRIVSRGPDGVKIWSTKSNDPLATVLGLHSGKWLLIVPAGFFTGVLGGAELFTLVRGLEVTSIDQVHQSLFNPDLVREALAGDPNGEVRRAAEVINLEKVLDSGPAPTVAITSHVAGAKSDTDLVVVTARITDKGKGVGRIEFRVNGVTAGVLARPPGEGAGGASADGASGLQAGHAPKVGQPEAARAPSAKQAGASVSKPEASREHTVSQQLALDTGENVIEVVAYNASNLLASVAARTTINFTGSADTAKPKLHVLAIGIDTYTDPGHAGRKFAPLGLAVKDAKALGAAFAEAGREMYAETRVAYALDADATPAGIEGIDRPDGQGHPPARHVHPVRCRAWYVGKRPLLPRAA